MHVALSSDVAREMCLWTRRGRWLNLGPCIEEARYQILVPSFNSSILKNPEEKDAFSGFS